MTRQILFATLFFGSCGYALWRGGAPERVAAAILLVGGLASPLLASGASDRFFGVEPGIFLADLLILLGLLWLVVRADRFWPIWMAAIQLTQTSGHILRAADPTLHPWIYWFTSAMWSYPILLILAIGTVRHQRRLAKSGVDPSWSHSSSRSPAAMPIRSQRD
jgi:hypothetical protein